MSINYFPRFRISYLDLGNFIGRLHAKKEIIIGLVVYGFGPTD